jgi:hypothetical protein
MSTSFSVPPAEQPTDADALIQRQAATGTIPCGNLAEFKFQKDVLNARFERALQQPRRRRPAKAES